MPCLEGVGREKETLSKNLPLENMYVSMARMSHMAPGLMNTEVASGHSYHSRDQYQVKVLISLFSPVSKTSSFQCKMQ